MQGTATLNQNTLRSVNQTTAIGLSQALAGTQQQQEERSSDFVPLAHEVIDMFESEYTKSLPERKANSIISYCRQRPNGFYYEEVGQLTAIMKYAEDDLLERGITEMIAAIQSILETNLQTKNFFLRNRHSDEFKYAPKVPAFLNTLGKIL